MKAWAIFIALLLVAGAAGAAVNEGFHIFKKPCAEIVVTGTPGVSRMAFDGNDLFLTGVAKVRCGVYTTPEPRQIGF